MEDVKDFLNKAYAVIDEEASKLTKVEKEENKHGTSIFLSRLFDRAVYSTKDLTNAEINIASIIVILKNKIASMDDVMYAYGIENNKRNKEILLKLLLKTNPTQDIRKAV